MRKHFIRQMIDDFDLASMASDAEIMDNLVFIHKTNSHLFAYGLSLLSPPPNNSNMVVRNHSIGCWVATHMLALALRRQIVALEQTTMQDKHLINECSAVANLLPHT